MAKIYTGDKICGYQLEYTLTGSKLGIKREDETNFQYFDFKSVGIDFKVDGTKLGIKYGDETEYQYFEIGGKNLEFEWSGTKLGVRVEGTTDYSYTDLKGPGLDFEWNGTQLGVKADTDTNYTYTELKGEKGDSNILSLGTVNIVDYDKGAASITGTSPAQILNLDIPRAMPTTFSIGTVVEGEFGATITGEAPNQTLNLSLKRGNSIQYDWQGTKLGVKVEGETDYIYTDLQGAPGEVTSQDLAEKLSEAVTESKEYTDTQIANYDPGTSIPAGAIITFSQDSAVPTGFVLPYQNLVAANYPELVKMLGTTNYYIGTLNNLKLTSNTSNSRWQIVLHSQTVGTPSTDWWKMFDGDSNTNYTLGSTESTLNFTIRIYGDIVTQMIARAKVKGKIQMGLSGFITNNSTVSAYPYIALNGVAMSNVTNITVPASSTKSVSATFDYNLTAENLTNSSITLNMAIEQNCTFQITNMYFMDTPVYSETLYVKMPYNYIDTTDTYTKKLMYTGRK